MRLTRDLKTPHDDTTYKKILEMLEKKGIIESIKLAEKSATALAEELNIKKTEKDVIDAISIVLIMECNRNEELRDTIVIHAIELIAKEILNIINKGEEKCPEEKH